MTDTQFQKHVLEILNKLVTKVDSLGNVQNEFKGELSDIHNHIDAKTDEIIAEIHLNKKYTDQSFEEISHLIKRVDALEAKVNRLSR